MENATQSVQILLVRRYLKRISDAICAPPHILTEAITNFTIPSDYQGLFTIYALQVIERTCTKESIIKKLERLAPVLSKAQLITVLATIDHTLEQIEIDALLALGRCDCEPYGGPVKKCGRCKVSLCNKCSRSILVLCKTMSESTARKQNQERYMSLAAKRVYSPCEKCLGEAVMDELDVDSTGCAKQCECVLSAAQSIIRRSSLSAAVHCSECFTNIVKDMRSPNTQHKYGRGIMGEVDLLMYSCDCGNSSSPDTVRICRLCRGICRPYTLNKWNPAFPHHSKASFEFTEDAGVGNAGTFANVGDDWDHGYCPFILKPEFFMD